MASTFEASFDVCKVSPSLGLVFAWGMVCSKNGKPYRDTDAERVTPTEMLKAVTEFGEAAVQPIDEMHGEEQVGSVVFSMPMTDDVAEAFGIKFADDPDQVTEGWMVAVAPEPDVLAKFADGTYTGFSIGGTVESFAPDTAAAA